MMMPSRPSRTPGYPLSENLIANLYGFGDKQKYGFPMGNPIQRHLKSISNKFKKIKIKPLSPPRPPISYPTCPGSATALPSGPCCICM